RAKRPIAPTKGEAASEACPPILLSTWGSAAASNIRASFMRILLSVILPACLAAQAPTEPPPIIQLVRKPGIAAASVRPYGDTRAAIDVVGLTAVTGLPETWFVEAHYNWASIEDLDRGLASAGYRTPDNPGDLMQDDVLAPSRTMLAT